MKNNKYIYNFITNSNKTYQLKKENCYWLLSGNKTDKIRIL